MVTSDVETKNVVSCAKEVDEICGYITTKKVSQMLTDAIRANVPNSETETYSIISTARLQFNPMLECVKIADILLFTIDSVNSYIPTFIEERKKEKEKSRLNALLKEKRKEKRELLKTLNDKYGV